MNQFENTGAAVVLPKLTGGSYDALNRTQRTLLQAQKQLREDQRWQDRQRAEAEEFNYGVLKDLTEKGLEDLDAIHRQAVSDDWTGWLIDSRDALKEANKRGERVDPSSLLLKRRHPMKTVEKAAAHQQEMGMLANTLKSDKNGVYKSSLYSDAMKKGFVTDEYGRINPNQFNTGYETGSIQAMLQDPKYKNAEAMLDSYVKNQGQSLTTRFSLFRDDDTDQYFNKKDRFEYNTAVFGDELDWTDDLSTPKIISAKEFALDLKGNDPETFEALRYEAEQEGVDVVTKVQNFLDKQGVLKKGSDMVRVPTPKKAGKKEKEYTFTVAQGGSGEFQDDVKNYEGDAIPMSQFIKNVTISDGGQSKSMDFEGFYINPETKQPSFKFTTSKTYNARELNDIFVDLNDEETIAKLRNQLPEGSAKRKAFDKAFNEAKALESRETGFNDERISANTDEIIKLVKSGDIEDAVAIAESIGISDLKPVKNNFNSNGIIIDDKEYFTKSDAEQIKKLLIEKVKGEKGFNPYVGLETADDIGLKPY